MKEQSATLWAYISNQEQTIRHIFARIETLRPINDDQLVHLAYQMHNLYSAYEDMFKEISETFENNIERSSGFHKSILIRMKIEIPGIRPNVLSVDSYDVLGELMGFRHVFRHAYNYSLSVDKMQLLRNRVIEMKPQIDADINGFKKFLESLFTI